MDNFPDRITVTVTEDDIRLGCAKQHNGCPIARAAQRVLPNQEVSVGAVLIFNQDFYLSAVYHLPESALRFEQKFDNLDFVEPFTFIADRRHS